MTRLLAVVGAAVAALAVWLVAEPLLGIDVRVPEGPSSTALLDLSPVTILVSVLVVSAAGWALLAVLERFAGRARTIWTYAALGLLTLSLFGPVTARGLPVDAKATLVVMHLAVALVLVPALTRTSPAR